MDDEKINNVEENEGQQFKEKLNNELEIDEKKNVNNKEERNNTKIMKQKSNRKEKIILLLILLALFLLVFSVVFALININNEKILDKVSIMGIDIGGLTTKEATEKLNEIVSSKINAELELKKDDYETSINANQVNGKFDVESAVNEAYSIGRNGNIVANNYGILFTWIFGKEIDCAFQYDEELLNKKVDDISSKLPNAVVQSSYYIEGDNLIIVKGKEGLKIKKDELCTNIINQMQEVNSNYTVITIPTENVMPDEIDIGQIRNEIYKEPENAYVSENPKTVHPHVNGVDFKVSIEEAKKILEEDKEEYTIPLKITVAEKTISDLGEEAFPDELASYSTIYDPSNKNRSNNIEISTEKIDGTIVLPGETFSYNQTVGERTIAEGYKEAGAYAGGKVVQDVGGGICQTSSTLYNAALLANLEIVDRSNHMFLTSYVLASQDATVAWGSIDFQFKNNRTYPIIIKASAKNGVCEMSIYGIKEETEYEVIIQSNVLSYIPYETVYEDDPDLEAGVEVVEQSGYTGCTSEAYRILKLNGEVVSKTLLSKDTYDPMTRIIRRGTKET